MSVRCAGKQRCLAQLAHYNFLCLHTELASDTSWCASNSSFFTHSDSFLDDSFSSRSCLAISSHGLRLHFCSLPAEYRFGRLHRDTMVILFCGCRCCSFIHNVAFWQPSWMSTSYIPGHSWNVLLFRWPVRFFTKTSLFRKLLSFLQFPNICLAQHRLESVTFRVTSHFFFHHHYSFHFIMAHCSLRACEFLIIGGHQFHLSAVRLLFTSKTGLGVCTFGQLHHHFHQLYYQYVGSYSPSDNWDFPSCFLFFKKIFSSNGYFSSLVIFLSSLLSSSFALCFVHFVHHSLFFGHLRFHWSELPITVCPLRYRTKIERRFPYRQAYFRIFRRMSKIVVQLPFP